MRNNTWRAVIGWAMLATACDIALARLSFGLLLPAIRTDLPGNYALYGTVTSLHLAGYLFGTLIGPAAVRRLGGTGRAVLVAHLLVALTVGVSAFSSTVFALTIARVSIGIVTGVAMVALIAGGLERLPIAHRMVGSGLIWGGAALGLAVSAAAAPALLRIHGGWREGTVAIAALTLVVAIGAGITYLRTAEQPPAAVTGERAFAPSDLVTARYFFMILAYAGFGAAYIAYATFIVSALHAQGATSATIASLWAVFGIAGFLGSIAARFVVAGRYARFGLCSALLVAALGCTIGSAPGMMMAFLGSVAVGLGLTATPAIASYQARARSSAATGAQALAAVTGSFGIGQILGPIFAGTVADRFGPQAISVFAAAVYTLSAVAAAIDATCAGSIGGRCSRDLSAVARAARDTAPAPGRGRAPAASRSFQASCGRRRNRTSMKIAVTGSAGTIGRPLCADLARDHDVVRIDLHDADLILDVQDLDGLTRAFAGCDVVIHLAGVVAVEASWAEVHGTNMNGTYNAFEAARRAGVTRVIFASSNHAVGMHEAINVPDVYEPKFGMIVRTDGPFRPDSLYGVWKAFGETLGSYYSDTHHMKVACIRIGSITKEDDPRHPSVAQSSGWLGLTDAQKFKRYAATWMSQRDFARLVRAILDKPVPYAVVYGVGDNATRFWDLEPGRAIFGFWPKDGA